MSKPREIEGHIGHYGNGSGASSLVDEVKECRKIAQRVHGILDEHNIPNTLYEDKVSKSQRSNINHLVAHHNKDDDGLVVSYHLNASGGVTSAAIGCEVLYSTQKQLATNLSAAIAASGGFKNRGAKYRDNLGVLTGTIEPAIIVETFFVNSRKDVELYNTNFEAICFAIAKVLAAAIGYNITKQPTKPATVSKAHRVKTGAFNSADAAKQAQALMDKYGIASSKWSKVVKDGNVWRILTGTYPSKDAAEAAIKQMQQKGILTVAYAIE